MFRLKVATIRILLRLVSLLIPLPNSNVWVLSITLLKNFPTRTPAPHLHYKKP